jgi:hypothetical protein
MAVTTPELEEVTTAAPFGAFQPAVAEPHTIESDAWADTARQAIEAANAAPASFLMVICLVTARMRILLVAAIEEVCCTPSANLYLL